MTVAGTESGLDLQRGVTGYLHRSYAESLQSAGRPVRLEGSGGFLVERDIPGSRLTDAMGSYPILCCQDWRRLGEDLDALGDRLVAVTLVTDPFGDYDVRKLHSWFPAVCRPFKEHAIVDLGRDPSSFVSSHHRRNVKKALQHVEVELCERPPKHLGEWTRLYGYLVERHDIRGVPAFSDTAFHQQLQVPGLVMFRALRDDETVGMILWYLQGDIGYYHLAAYSERGYRLRASFALFWRSIEYLAARVRWLGLGANAGTGGRADGLSRFKSGWATGTRMAWLCGRIMNAGAYQTLTAAHAGSGAPEADGFFPTYRQP